MASQTPPEPTRVRDVMRTEILTLDPETPLQRALQTLLWSGARQVPVVREGAFVGLLGERDILRHQSRLGDWRALEGRVADAMATGLDTASPEDDLEMIHRRLAVIESGCLPVVERGRLLGMVGTTDLLAWLGRRAFGEAGPRGPTVGEVMSAEPYRIGRNDYLVDAAERMSVAGVRHLPVVDGEGRVVGIVSDRDVRVHLGEGAWLAATQDEEASASMVRVADVMTRDPITVHTDAPLLTAVAFFVDWRIGAIPVVDASDRLVGIVSYVDALRFVLREPARGTDRTGTPRD